VKASYKRLWKLLIDRDMKKLDLSRLVNISPATLTKMTRGENVNMDILVRLGAALDCDLGDIVELVPDNDPTGN
jgi:DNA-binding Xre family transcriptional regulator